ncbi:MAG: hypothetical protein CR986_08540 [Ignavibacteriae bacterium]|nr:MAG: hypothetical protein CR986_08540 [Ignavibacteriota bacterium]
MIRDKEDRQEMHSFVQEISIDSKSINPDFIIIPQKGTELLSTTRDDNGSPEMEYINAIDRMG